MVPVGTGPAVCLSQRPSSYPRLPLAQPRNHLCITTEEETLHLLLTCRRISPKSDGEVTPAKHPRILKAAKGSFFLFWLGATGKSTWLRTTFPTAHIVNLLDEALYQCHLAKAELFADEQRREAPCRKFGWPSYCVATVTIVGSSRTGMSGRHAIPRQSTANTLIRRFLFISPPTIDNPAAEQLEQDPDLYLKDRENPAHASRSHCAWQTHRQPHATTRRRASLT